MAGVVLMHDARRIPAIPAIPEESGHLLCRITGATDSDFVVCGRAWRVAMSLSEQFLRFAHECESMAKSAVDLENGLVWRRIAERWVRCAGLAERHADGRKMRAVSESGLCQIG